jgi:hypothetical protein
MQKDKYKKTETWQEKTKLRERERESKVTEKKKVREIRKDRHRDEDINGETE